MLEIEGLVVRYGARSPVLHEVGLDVAEAGVVALLGANGAGKTSLMRAVSGTLPLHGGSVAAGSIRFRGRDVTRGDPAAMVAAGLVQVPEGRHVFGALTVDENLDAGAITVRSRGERARARDEMFGMFPRLAERRRQRAGTLSGGEQQMLAIARALMSRPKLLLLDEPSLGLAPMLVKQIGEKVREISREGVPVLLVEQNAAMALEIADRAHVLELGRIVLSGPADELSRSDEVGRLYLGDGAAGDPVGSPAGDPALPRLARWSA
ncbi:ABC transporter ATP-binding protein [Actinomadura sp. WMMB 499]|uniref:ABC transporter ATP-binding protein n=1 Tax=Actinomadura sp. WMMB 499 TaxID=1219491 RepID=UPI001249226A|nr:ABC transporter ATP-binding protein [Actinomadura sp. WMMB 499]QFG22210.1 ABC transporter ATP-binding protein [Actinomadura sp. WMMB 499]